MKPILTKEALVLAMEDRNKSGTKITLASLHGALGNRCGLSTLVRLKAEIEAEMEQPKDSAESLQAVRRVWDMARSEGLKEPAQVTEELREYVGALAIENERLEGVMLTMQCHARELEQERVRLGEDLNQRRVVCENELRQATVAIQDADRRATDALQDLAETRRTHGLQLADLQVALNRAQPCAHQFELQYFRMPALLEAKSVSPAAN